MTETIGRAEVGASILDKTITKAGADAVLMVSPDYLGKMGDFTESEHWECDETRMTYRGAFVELHDEWSWGWMVRDRDGQFVNLSDADGV